MKQFIVGQVPDCCEQGNVYITLQAKNFARTYHRNNFAGWGLSVDYSCDSQMIEQAFYCPFCGKKLEVIK